MDGRIGIATCSSMVPDEHWNCFKDNLGETSERRGGAHMDFSEGMDTTLN